MQATLSASRRTDLPLWRPAVMFRADVLLLGPPRGGPCTPVSQVPEVPASWLPIPGSHIVTGAQRFAAYRCVGGLEIHLHSTVGLGDIQLGAAVARLTLGSQRVGVYAVRDGYEARWNNDEAHRLAATRIDLAGFMELLLGLTWQ